MIPPNLSVKSFEGFDVNNMFLGTAFKASPLIPKSVGGNNSNSWTVSHIHPPASNKLKPNIPRAVTDIGTLSGIQTSSINTIVKGVLPGSSVGLEISSTAGSRIDSISSISLQDISVTSSIGNDAITRVMATSSKAATTKTSSRTSVSATTINPASVNSNSSSMMNSESRLKEASAISANSWYISGPISYHGVYNSTKIASEVRLFPRQNSAASQNPAATAVAAEEQVHTVQQSILTRKHPHSNSGAIQPATITRATLQKWKSFNLNKNSNPSPPSNISTYESTAAILNAVNLPKEFRHSNTKSGYFSSLELPSPTYPNGYTMGLEEQNQLISTLTRENSASSMRPLTASKRRQALRMGLENSLAYKLTKSVQNKTSKMLQEQADLILELKPSKAVGNESGDMTSLSEMSSENQSGDSITKSNSPRTASSKSRSNQKTNQGQQDVKTIDEINTGADGGGEISSENSVPKFTPFSSSIAMERRVTVDEKKAKIPLSLQADYSILRKYEKKIIKCNEKQYSFTNPLNGYDKFKMRIAQLGDLAIYTTTMDPFFMKVLDIERLEALSVESEYRDRRRKSFKGSKKVIFQDTQPDLNSRQFLSTTTLKDKKQERQETSDQLLPETREEQCPHTKSSTPLISSHTESPVNGNRSSTKDLISPVDSSLPAPVTPESLSSYAFLVQNSTASFSNNNEKDVFVQTVPQTGIDSEDEEDEDNIDNIGILLDEYFDDDADDDDLIEEANVTIETMEPKSSFSSKIPESLSLDEHHESASSSGGSSCCTTPSDSTNQRHTDAANVAQPNQHFLSSLNSNELMESQPQLACSSDEDNEAPSLLRDIVDNEIQSLSKYLKSTVCFEERELDRFGSSEEEEDDVLQGGKLSGNTKARGRRSNTSSSSKQRPKSKGSNQGGIGIRKGTGKSRKSSVSAKSSRGGKPKQYQSSRNIERDRQVSNDSLEYLGNTIQTTAVLQRSRSELIISNTTGNSASETSSCTHVESKRRDTLSFYNNDNIANSPESPSANSSARARRRQSGKKKVERKFSDLAKNKTLLSNRSAEEEYLITDMLTPSSAQPAYLSYRFSSTEHEFLNLKPVVAPKSQQHLTSESSPRLPQQLQQSIPSTHALPLVSTEIRHFDDTTSTLLPKLDTPRRSTTAVNLSFIAASSSITDHFQAGSTTIISTIKPLTAKVKKIKEHQTIKLLKRKKSCRTKAVDDAAAASISAPASSARSLLQFQPLNSDDLLLSISDLDSIQMNHGTTNTDLFNPLEQSVQSLLNQLSRSRSDIIDANSNNGSIIRSNEEERDQQNVLKGFEPSQIYLRNRKAFGGFLPFLRETYTLNEIDQFVNNSTSISSTNNSNVAAQPKKTLTRHFSDAALCSEVILDGEEMFRKSTADNKVSVKSKQHNFMKQTASTSSKTRSKNVK